MQMASVVGFFRSGSAQTSRLPQPANAKPAARVNRAARRQAPQKPQSRSGNKHTRNQDWEEF